MIVLPGMNDLDKLHLKYHIRDRNRPYSRIYETYDEIDRQRYPAREGAPLA